MRRISRGATSVRRWSRGRNDAGQVEAGQAVDALVPLQRVVGPHAVVDVVADARPALEARLARGHAGARRCSRRRRGSPAAPPRASPSANAAMALVRLRTPSAATTSPPQQILVHAGGLQDPAADGEQGAERRMRRIEVGWLHAFGADPAGLEQRAQLGEGDDRVDLAGHVLVGRLHLLAHARTDENHAQVVAVDLSQRPRLGDHGRHDRRQVVHQVGVVALDEAHHRRAGRGDVARPLVLAPAGGGSARPPGRRRTPPRPRS